ncbi:MAG: hypothetical protein QM779_13040 [Propionicimonas sp.]|uniref:hypothetical protein n=1 Tax=Propionicimonas sp. TaxID=1955623 RepID=UPI003D0F2854
MAEESRRQADARRRHELAQASAQAEARAAQTQLDAFVARLGEAGAAPEPLQATLLNGTRVKTPLVGWYLNRARTLAVAPDGRYYQLITTGSALARFTGVTPQPSDPTLVIGRGGRDGETGDLAEFLERAFAEYTSR